MKRDVLLIFIVAMFFNAKAQNSIIIPDANFAAYLQGIVPTAMNGNQMDTTNPSVTITTDTIIAQNISISDLTGIQYFKSLTYLDCRGNNLNNIPPLPHTLLHLCCFWNLLSSIPNVPNSLQYLDCSTNNITSVNSFPDSLRSLILW